MSTGPLTQEQLIKLSHVYHNDDLHGALERVVQVAARLGMELAAQECEKRAEERFLEHGTREDDTNATYYDGRDADEYDIRDEEDDECAADIRERARK